MKFNNTTMKKILLVVLLVPFFGFAQLSGTYLVGSGQAAPFDNLPNAIARIQSVGVSGPVTFSLTTDVTASGSMIFTAIPGSSAANTLTIKPAATKTITITANNLNSYTGVPGVFIFNGVSNVILDGSNAINGTTRNMTINNNNNINYCGISAVFIASNGSTGSNNITVKNTILKTTNRNQDGLWCLGVYSGNYSVTGNNGLNASNATAANSNTTISNNQFVNVRQGIFINSSTTTSLKSSNISITGNAIGSTVSAEKPSLGLNLINISNFTVQNNTFSGMQNSSNGDPYTNVMIVDNCNDYSIRLNTITNYSHTINHMIGSAIFLKGDSNVNGKILENTIQNIKNTGGGIIRAIDIDLNSSVNNNLLIANNFISDITSSGTTTNNGNGVLIRKGKDIKIYHNTIAMNTNQGNTSAALCINGGSDLDIINNIFTNTSTSGAPYGVYATVANSAFTNINYNNYYATNIGYLGGNKTTLATWQAATGKDVKSLNELPAFVSSTDLHLTTANCALNGKGTPLAAITIDIDNETRSTSTPDIGADEFNSVKCCNTTTWGTSGWSNGIPTSSVKAIINSNYSTNTADINTCELLVNTGFTLTITSNHYVKVENNVTVNGSLIVENNGSLVQVDDTATSTGSIVVKRKTTRMKLYDFTYWSSPVKGMTLYQLSPNTLSDKYFSFNPLTNNYVLSNYGVDTMLPAVGYLVRAPQGWSATNSTEGVYEGIFTGVPNTGIIPVTIQKGAGTYNLIGNPYPCAIDIDAFITDNTNKGLVNGMIALWTHNTAISSATPGNYIYNYSSDDYAKYTLTGGIKTVSAAFPGGAVPDGKVASGQAFFIEAKTSLSNGTYTANFNNSMRITGNNAGFYRTQPGHNPTHNNVEKNRLWVHMSNDQGAYNETLLGYLTGATNEYDNLYDGKTFEAGNVLSLYTLIGTDRYCIQGRALPFNENETIPLGYSTTLAGTFSIGIENLDGFFHNQQVFLFDKLDGTYHNLKEGSYSFVTATGIYNDRFELRFTDALLGTEPVINVANSLIIYTAKQEINFSAKATIKSIEIYDLSGRIIFTGNNIDAVTYTIADLNIHSQVVIAKIKLDDNTVVARKVLLN